MVKVDLRMTSWASPPSEMSPSRTNVDVSMVSEAVLASVMFPFRVHAPVMEYVPAVRLTDVVGHASGVAAAAALRAPEATPRTTTQTSRTQFRARRISLPLHCQQLARSGRARHSQQ